MSKSNGQTTAAEPLVNQEAIVKALQTILAPGQVTELRALDAVAFGDRRPTADTLTTRQRLLTPRRRSPARRESISFRTQ